ncbi:hypothetical protein INR49_032810 [Caranx melampygus]|nr:hypothetical protein INR49_032810 [Caranx melampygus]
MPQKLRNAKPEVFSCTAPEPIKSPTQPPQSHKSTAPVNKSRKPPDIELQVKDPYDDLLTMILDGSTSKENVDFSRWSPIGSPPLTLTHETQSSLKLKAEESHQTEGKTQALTPASQSAGSVRLEVQFHKPMTMEPLSITWGEQPETLNDDKPMEFERPLSVKGKGFTELFIEEEDDALEEDIRVLSDRLSPQADVSPSALMWLSHPGLSSPSILPPLTSTPPPLLLLPLLPPLFLLLLRLPLHTLDSMISTPPLHLPLALPGPHPFLSSQRHPCLQPPPLRRLSHHPPFTPLSPPQTFSRSVQCLSRQALPLDPVVGGKPPRSPILSRRSYLSPVRGRRRLVQDALHGGGDPYQALYNYMPRNEDELELREGDVVDVMEKCDDGWFVGTSRRSKLFGTFPGNYVKQL